VAHLTEGHVKERVRRSLGTGLLGSFGRSVTGIESRQAAEVVFQLPFQREQEREADSVGMLFEARAGYDPSAALELWKEMGGDRRGRPPEIFSTHPDPDFRMRDIALNSLTPSLIAYNEALDAGVRPLCHY
jgi:predicted Zn-dependent protease